MARRVTVVVVGALALLGVAFGGILEPARADDRPFLTQLLAGPTTTTTKPKPKTPVPAWTNTVSPNGEVQVFDAPNGRVVGTAGYFFGYDQWMPMLGRQERLAPGAPARAAQRQDRLDQVLRGVLQEDAVPDRDATGAPPRSRSTRTAGRSGAPPSGWAAAKTPTPLGKFYVSVIDHDRPSRLRGVPAGHHRALRGDPGLAGPGRRRSSPSTGRSTRSPTSRSAPGAPTSPTAASGCT